MLAGFLLLGGALSPRRIRCRLVVVVSQGLLVPKASIPVRYPALNAQPLGHSFGSMPSHHHKPAVMCALSVLKA